MDVHKLFLEFDSKIRLSESKISKLKSNRKALRDKVKAHFDDKGWKAPKFYSQGSFPLNTNLNPIKTISEDGDIKEEYDLDDGVYFICPESERKEVATYHDRIKKAVDGHAGPVIDKTTCVRVVYADGHHIDLPLYWLDKDGDTPLLAHKSKGYIKSDPKAFKDWVDGKISDAESNGQLRRIIRYLKAWKNFREDKNNSLRLPSGFILTILACKHFLKDSRDDLSMLETVKAIKNALETSYCCYRPTVPTDEDLLADYSKETIIDELTSLIKSAEAAIASETEEAASEIWRKIFGERFPSGAKNASATKAASPVIIKASSPWSSN